MPPRTGRRTASPPVRKVIMAAGVFRALGDPVAKGVVELATLTLARRREDLEGRTRIELADGCGDERRVTVWRVPSAAGGGDVWGLAFVASLGPSLAWPSLVAWTVRFDRQQARIEAVAVSDKQQVIASAVDAWSATAIAGELQDGALAASARLALDPLGWEIRFRVSVDPGVGAARKLERRMPDLLVPLRVVIVGED